MGPEILLEKIESLSQNDRKEVLDFIDFLRNRKKRFAKRRTSTTINLEDEKFIGMWKDKPEMRDSSEWVRNLRKTEWAD